MSGEDEGMEEEEKWQRASVALERRKKNNPQDTACLNNPKLFFNHSLENWLGPSAGDSCSAAQSFNEIR